MRAAADLREPFAEIARHARRLELQGLTADDVARLIETAAGRRPSAALTTDVHDVTNGNPFFVDELLRLLAMQGRLRPIEPVFASLPIPEGIRDAVRRRLEPLSANARTLLEIAAVAGRESDTAVLRLASGLDPMAVAETLEEPLEHGLLLPTEGSRGRFAFRHVLIQEVIYEGLPLARRLLLHRRLVDAFATLAAGNPELHVAELAHHALAAAPSGQDDDFVAHGIRAAQHAMRRMAFEEAVRLYERTIDATAHVPADERRRCELLLALGHAQEWANDPAGSRATAERAAAIARHLGASELLARAALGVGSVEALKLTASSRCDGAPALLREALAAIEASETATRARLQSRLAMHSLASGARQSGLQLSLQAIGDARSSADRDALVQALVARHAVLLGPDHLDERCTIAAEILDLAMTLGNREYAMRSHALRAANFFDLGDIPAADDAIAEHSRLADESADPFERWVNLMWRSARALLVGRFAEATRFSELALQLSQAVPGPHAFEINGPMTHVGQTILIQEARHDGVPEQDVIDRYRRQYPEVALWHVARLHRLTRLGLVDDVRREIDGLTGQSIVDFERNATWLPAMSFLAEAITLVGDRERAGVLYDVLLPYAHRNATVIMITSRGSIGRWLGLLATTLERHDDAAKHFEAALAMNKSMGARPLVAVTLLDQASGLLARGDAGDVVHARDLAREAHTLASDLGMPGLVDRCAGLLDSVADRPAAPAPAGEGFHLTRDGQFWKLSRAGSSVLLKNAKGLVYLAELVQNPGAEIHVLDLVAAYARERTAGVGASDDEAPPGGGYSESLLDRRARAAYQQRLASLGEQLAAAEASGDPEPVFALRQEITSLQREIARTTGLGGRARRSSDAERARISVTRTIRLALARIVDASPELGGELARSIRTGTFCRYVSSTPSSAGHEASSFAASLRERTRARHPGR